MKRTLECNCCTYHTAEDNMCIDEYSEFDELLDSNEPIEMLGMFFPVSEAIKNLDPVAYRCGVKDYVDEMITNGEWVEL